MTEREIEEHCSQWLELDGWRTLKTDPVSDKGRGKGFGELGMADRLYIRYQPPARGWISNGSTNAEVVWIEWKRVRTGRKTATQATIHQKLWHAGERARGAFVLLAGVDFPATIDGFKDYYRASGLQRRKL